MQEERHRPYFKREIVFGRRVVFEWNAFERWPDWPDAANLYPDRNGEIIEAVEFATEDEAAAFDVRHPSRYRWEMSGDWTWDDAVEWVLGKC